MKLAVVTLDLGDILSDEVETCHPATFQKTLEVPGINFQDVNSVLDRHCLVF